MHCARCDRDVDVRDPELLYEVTGWERLRAEGGQNHVRFRTRTGRLLCGSCATDMRYTGGQGAQERLAI